MGVSAENNGLLPSRLDDTIQSRDAGAHRQHELILVAISRWGCTDNDCNGDPSTMYVFVTPVTNADLYVDYKNNGTRVVIPAGALSSTLITDPSDNDMSGALIFATAPGTGPNGTSVVGIICSANELAHAPFFVAAH
jgi:hypothetical protein